MLSVEVADVRIDERGAIVRPEIGMAPRAAGIRSLRKPHLSDVLYVT